MAGDSLSANAIGTRVLCGWKEIEEFFRGPHNDWGGRSERWFRKIASDPTYPNPLPLQRPGMSRGSRKPRVTMRESEAVVWGYREGLCPLPVRITVNLSCGPCSEVTDHRFEPRYVCCSCGTTRSI